ncbi:MAG: FAD-dependent oxidoreductase [Candidatus Aenigmarchaeota archaeon]|nr:FAD-dependent oxidoreductase [Candidatus Aenigmarchaeota archaeon]
MKTISAAVTGVRENTPTVKTITLKPAEPIIFKPGQWIYVFADNGGKKVKRAYSIAAPPGEIRLCVKCVKGGFMSNRLCNTKKGDTLEIAGPFGAFTFTEPSGDVAFIATGTGIAPFMSMLPTLTENGYTGKATVIFGARTEDEILYKDEMKEFSKRMRFEFIPVLSREPSWKGEKGHVQNVIIKKLKPDCDVYVCGLMPMVADVRKLLEEKGFDRKRVHFENYI